jgi:thiol:disulfide interchange protein DsbC
MVKTLLSLSILLPAMVANAVSLPNFQGISEGKTTSEKIKELEKNVARLPIRDIYYANGDSGTFIFSEGGRFIFQGKIYDSWQKKYITSLEDANASYEVPLEKIGINPDFLGALRTSNNKPDLIAFVDPNCGACSKLYKEIEGLDDEVSISFVLTNLAGGDKSSERIKQLYCMDDKQKALDSLLNNKEIDLPDMNNSDCDYSRLFNNLTAVQVLGIRSLPTLVTSSGKKIEGVPRDLEAFLAGEQ